jgi:hypothetical protein
MISNIIIKKESWRTFVDFDDKKMKKNILKKSILLQKKKTYAKNLKNLCSRRCK